jgi:hypothetical protein
VKRLLLLLVVSLPAQALEPGRYEMSVTVHFVQTMDEVRIQCALLSPNVSPLIIHNWIACAQKTQTGCNIIALTPASWKDHDRQRDLGH